MKKPQTKVTIVPDRHRQQGMVTVMTVIIVFVLMMGLVSYAVKVVIGEQRMSGNEMRHKTAFHTADSGLELATEWLLANRELINADVEDMLGAGLDGWFVTGSERWVQCADVSYQSDKSHPCWGDSVDSRRDQNYFYYHNGSTALPINAATYMGSATTQVTVEALLCLLDIDTGLDPVLGSIVRGCHTDPSLLDSSKFLVTLLARGQAECLNGVCRSEALVSKPVSNFSVVAFAKAPGIPLVTNSPFPATGNYEIIPNPDGGGIGVPLSVWANTNSGCPDHTPVNLTQGAWATCAATDWYAGAVPGGVACTEDSCSCNAFDVVSTTLAGFNILGDDIVLDNAFPCDLFEFYFGVPRSQYQNIKESVTVIDDCSTLGPESFGTYWVSGSNCQVDADTVIGSADNPVLLISAATLTNFGSGAEMYGLLFLTDIEDSTAELTTTGNATIYGAMVAESMLGNASGTLQVVYNDDIVAHASAEGGLGSITGGWTDFHKEWR